MSWGVALGLVVTGCGGGPQIKVTAEYRPEACTGQRVLLVPLAVSGAFGDKRTGVVLSDEARRSASEASCTKLAQSWDEGTLVCPPFDVAKKPPALDDFERAFALDEPVSPALYEALRGSFRADYALLFRPESVSSSNQVEHEKPQRESGALLGARVGVAAVGSPGMLVGSLIGLGAASQLRSKRTPRMAPSSSTPCPQL